MPDLIRERYINPYTDFGFKKLFEQAEIAKYDETERRRYYESQKEYWDYYSTMTTAMNKGIAKGRAEGRAEGIAEGRAEGIAEGRAEGIAEGRAEGIAKGRADVARNLKKKGMSVSDIADVTGLTEEEIKAL